MSLLALLRSFLRLIRRFSFGNVAKIAIRRNPLLLLFTLGGTNMHHDPLILTKRSAMQRMTDYARYGYHHFVTGLVPVEKLAPLVSKFTRYYQVHADKNARHRARAKGEGSAYLLLYSDPKSDRVQFILMVTDGDHPAHKLEKLKDLREPGTRLTLTSYELVRQTRSGSDKPVLTWRMTKDNYEAWRERIRKTVRTKGDKAVTEMLNSLVRSPGFSGIRAQVKKLGQLFRVEWKRSRHRNERAPAVGRIYYVQRLKNDGMYMSTFIKKWKQGSQS